MAVIVASVAANAEASVPRGILLAPYTSGSGLRATIPSEGESVSIEEFDPMEPRHRGDLDIIRWGRFAGYWPKPTRRSNAWKADPNRDMAPWRAHITRGNPTPPEWIARKDCIARRNARERPNPPSHPPCEVAKTVCWTLCFLMICALCN